MSDFPSSDKVSDQVHPVVLRAAAGLLIWFVVAAWLLFSEADYSKLALAMVSVLVFMAVGIPWALRRANVVAQRNAARDGAIPANVAEENAGVAPQGSLGGWMRGQLATWTDKEKASTAAVEILLPLAAVAFGITAIGIVFELTRAGIV
jgi:hypothetical protein